MTKLEAYEEAIERLDDYRDWVREMSYQDDVLWQLQNLGIVEIKIEVDEEKFKEVVEKLQDEVEEKER